MIENPINDNNLRRPTSVRVISIFYWVYALRSCLVGTLNIIPLISNKESGQHSTTLFSLLFVIIGLGLVVLVLFFVGLAIWQLKRWARWIAIAISILFVLISLGTFTNSLLHGQFSFPITAVAHALILLVLFNTNVKETFKSS